MNDYAQFLAAKKRAAPVDGFPCGALPPALFDFQRDIVQWACKRGRAAIFADTGLGKTAMQLAWAQQVPGRVLVVAPLAVAQQSVREGARFGIEAAYSREPIDAQITITNYEMLHHFDMAAYAGVVLDESSILKAYAGKTRTQIIESTRDVPYRLSCTATPSPNDFMELGNQCEFLGVLSRVEMLATYFTHDGGETSKWRLKGHGRRRFWEWLATWAVVIRKPSDIGGDDTLYNLPPLNMHEHVIASDKPMDGELFVRPALTLQDQRAARRASLTDRVAEIAKLVNGGVEWGSPEPSTGEHITPPTASSAAPISGRPIDGTPQNAGRPTSDGLRKTKSGTPRGSETTTPPTLSDTRSAGANSRSEGTDLMKRDSAQCSPSRMDAAPSAAIHQPPNATLTSTTITKPALCAASSATPATCASGDMEMTQPDSAPMATIPPPNTSNEAWLIWVNLNDEQDALEELFKGRCFSVRGSMSLDEKETAILAWLNGEKPIMISKPSVMGFGLNCQHCARIAFCGLSHSFEQLYQAIRRCWRFGQTRPVDVHIVTAEAEGQVLENIKRKESQHEEMSAEMVNHMRDAMRANIKGATHMRDDYEPTIERGEGWQLHLGDCVDVVSRMDADSIDYTIFSPPFASLYTYSASDRDMGNTKDDEDFAKHFGFLVPELFRVTKPGRLLSFHCMNLPTIKQHHGVIGLRDFRGELIAQFAAAGWIFHSEVCIWKDPVTAMQRTKALGLLHKQLKKDSAMSRQGVPDYLVTMRKPGDNPEPVTKTNESFPVARWQRYASPVWMDINASRTLQYRGARENDDERHICPLQLDVIERAIELWTNPRDLVLSPFAGIGSEGHVALQAGRRFVGAELKASYWRVACDNLAHATATTGDMFSATA